MLPLTPAPSRLENDLTATQTQGRLVQWLEEEMQHFTNGSDSSSVDPRLISAAKVLKAQQREVALFKEQSNHLSQVSASACVRLLGVV